MMMMKRNEKKVMNGLSKKSEGSSVCSERLALKRKSNPHDYQDLR